MPVPEEFRGTAILADGDFPTGKVAAAMLRNACRLVCCDGAAASSVKAGFVPDAIVGDCDSLEREFLENYGGEVVCESEQESNDLTKSVRYCLSKGYDDIVILGATGIREDHTLGNISLLADYAAMEGMKSVRMITNFGVFDVIAHDSTFESHAGQQVSIFCPDTRTLITTGNLLYPLKDAELRGWWRGSLNESLGDTFSIRTTGPALIYRLFAE